MLKNLFLVAGSLLITLGLLDLGFRLHPPAVQQVNNPARYTKMVGGLKIGIPYVSYIEMYPLGLDPRGYYRQSEGRIYYFLDEFGGRWTEMAARHLGKNVGIFVGDSLTYGFGLRYEDTFAYQLGRKLSPPVEFVNLAQPAADTVRALEVYQRVGKKISHQLLIYGLHLNDLIAFPTSYITTNPTLGKLSDWSPFLSYVLQKWDIAVNQPRRIREITGPEAMLQPFFRANFAAILGLAELAKRRKAAFYVAILPVLVQLKENTFAPVYARVENELRSHGINTIDLTGGLAGYRDQDLWITPFDQHPNEIANKIFLGKLTEALAK